MQAYGFTMSVSTSLGPKWTWGFPLFQTDGISELPKNFRSFFDEYLRHRNTFCRIRHTMSELVNNTSTYPLISQGGIFLKKTSTVIIKQWKDGNQIFDSSLDYISGWGYCCYVTVKEYQFSGNSASGLKYCTRSAGSGWVIVDYKPPFTESVFDSCVGIAKPKALTALSRATFSRWFACGSTIFETGTPTMAEMSVYSGEALKHFENLQMFGRPNSLRACSAAQAAYEQAVAKLPEITSNGIANIGELASLFSALLRRDVESAGKLIGSAWLAYRYSYTTSVSDCREIKRYIDRILTLSSGPSGSIRSHGYCALDGWTYHCVIRVNVDDILPSDLRNTLDQFGLELTAVNAWDMVPYSFIADWFIPVSDALQKWESHWKSRQIRVQECWISITSPTGDCFVRSDYSWQNSPPILRLRDVSNKTIFMRIADAIALLWK